MKKGLKQRQSKFARGSFSNIENAVTRQECPVYRVSKIAAFIPTPAYRRQTESEGFCGIFIKFNHGRILLLEEEMMESPALSRRQFFSLTGILGLTVLTGELKRAEAQTGKETRMLYQAKDYTPLFGMQGFSDTLLKNHFTLYQGYVTNTNKLLETLGQMLKEGKVSSPEFAEFKRRLGWEFNGMRLHEYYFENLGGKGGMNRGGKLFHKLVESFGSYEAWERDFRATGSMRGIGWAILYQDVLSGQFINFWINEHDVGHPAGGLPILIMDVFEHAFMIDYGLKRADYIEAFIKNINWAEAEKRVLLHKG